MTLEQRLARAIAYAGGGWIALPEIEYDFASIVDSDGMLNVPELPADDA